MGQRGVKSLTALLLTGVLALSACARGGGGDEPGGDDTQGTQANPLFAPGFYEQDAPGEPVSGGTLTFADFSETRSLDPTKTQVTGFSGGTVLTSIYDQLVRWNQREQELEPRLAEKIEPNDDHTQWTITLRAGVNFSDGTPVNADAVLGSFNYYLANKGSDLGVIGPKWAGAEKVDDRTVQVNLNSSWATFPFALGLGMGFIVAPAAIADGPDAFKPIGAGAFTFESYRPQEELVVAANPNYWDGAPYLDKIRFVWLGSDETKMDSLNAGNVQGAMTRDMTVVKKAREEEKSGWVFTESFGRIVMINRADGRPAGEYPQIAEAMAHAIDGEMITERAFGGAGIPSRHVFTPESKWYNENAKVRPYDTARATELVDEAKAAGFDGKIELHNTSDPISREISLTLTAQLEAVGFTVENDYSRTVADSINKTIVERDFDFSAQGRSLFDADPYWRLFATFHSKSAANISSFHDPAYDALVEELAATEGDDRRDVLNRIEDLILEDVPVITYAGNANMAVWGDTLHGVNPNNDGQLGFEKAWLSK